MKNNFAIFTLIQLLIFNLSINVASAQWIQSGPDGGYVSCMTQSGNNIYAVTGFLWFSSPGFYCSEDDGNTWTTISSNSLPGDIRDIATLGNSMFLGTGSGIYRSDDNGLTWVVKNNGFPVGGKWINHLAISGTTIFAAGTNESIIRSTDNGEHWTVVNSGLTDTYLYSLTANDNAIFAGTGDQMLGVFRSTDNGNTWQQVKNGMGYYDNGQWLYNYAPMITTMGFVGTVLYAGTSEFQGIWKSLDNGDNWVFTSMETMNYYEFNAFSGNESAILAGTRDGGGVIRSVNNGVSWSEANSGIGNYGQITTFLNKDGNTFVGSKGGVYKSENNGNSWAWSGNGIVAHKSVYPAFAAIGSDLFYGSETGGVFRSSDGGTSWLDISGGLPLNTWNLNSLYSNQSALFAWDRVSVDRGNTWEMAANYSPGSVEYGYNGPRWLEHGGFWFTLKFNENQGVYRSSNQGQNWIPMNNGIQGQPSPFFIHAEDERLFLGTTEGLYSSNDDGVTWSAGNFPNMNYWALNGASLISTETADICGLAGSGGVRGIYRTIDDGLNWVQVSDFLVHKFVKNGNIIFASGTNLELVNGEMIEVNRIFRSEDEGQNWTNISESLSGLSTISMESNGAILLISGISSGQKKVHCSPDNGDTWIDVSDNLNPNLFTSSFIFVDDRIFAATDGGSVFVRNIDEFSSPGQPGAISGTELPCTGSTEIYSVENVPGVTYTWQFPIDWIITSGNGTSSVNVTVGSASGIALVIPSNGFGSGPSQFKLVNPESSLVVSASITEDQNNICEGSTMTFTSSTSNGGSQPAFSWFVNDIPSSDNSPEFAYIPEDGDVVKLLFTSNANCAIQNQVESNTITTVVNSMPEVVWLSFEPDSLCINWAPVLLSGAIPEGGAYSGAGVINNSFDPKTAGPGSHVITYSFTDINNCSGQASILIVVNTCAGIPEHNARLVVYPNPASEYLNVMLKDGMYIDRIELFNHVGYKVFSKANLNFTGLYSIPVLNYPAGSYILKITGKNETFVKSVILQ
jgi:photosystem II stability/assembly factor-like uncharacterized protein